MKTHLIVLTSLDELRANKDELVHKFDDDGNLKKYSDDSIETFDDQVFFLKVITLSEYRTKLIQAINRGYDSVKIDSVRKEINDLLDMLNGAVRSEEHFGHLEAKKIVEPATEEDDEPDDEFKAEVDSLDAKTDEELIDENL